MPRLNVVLCCELAVDSLSKAYVKLPHLYTLATCFLINVVKRTIIVRKVCTAYEQSLNHYPHAFFLINSLNFNLYPLCTGPNNTNNLYIKDLKVS